MIAALLIIGGWQTTNVLLILAAARLGVVRLTVARPAKRPGEARAQVKTG